jgi:hypothetical protein
MITVEADPAVIVDVGVEHLGEELDLGWFCGVLLCELEFELEQSPIPCGALGPLDEGSPEEEVAFLRRSVDAFVLLAAQLGKIADEPLLGWSAHTFLINYLIRHDQNT